MLRYTDDRLARQRARTAVNSRSYRQRFDRGQIVLYITAILDHAKNAATRAGYLSMGARALVSGAIATTRELSLAVDLGAATIILMNVATLVLATTTPATISPSTVAPLCI